MENVIKRFLSLAMAVLLVFSNIPASVFASEAEECSHGIVTVSSTATCTEAGVTTTTCSVCDEVISTEDVAATGHSYADGVCGTCGANDPDYIAPVDEEDTEETPADETQEENSDETPDEPAQCPLNENCTLGEGHEGECDAPEAESEDDVIDTVNKLEAAIDAAEPGDTVTIGTDLQGVGITISNDVIIDLGGNTITDAYIKIEADVTIQNGSIKNIDESYPLVVNKGTLTVEGVAIEASKSDRTIWLRNSGTTLNFNSGSILATKGDNNTYSTIYGVWVCEGATANINGGSITVDAGPDATAVAIYGNYVNTVNVYGGKISTSGKNYSYAIHTNGAVTVTDGEIVTNEKQYCYSSGITYGYNYAINTKGDVKISGGTITTYGPSGYLVNAGGSNQQVTISNVTFTNVLSETDRTTGGHSEPNLIKGSSVTATISGGNFKGVSEELIKGTGSTLTISGGTFDVAIKPEYAADGYEVKDGVIVEKTYPAKIDSKGYATLQAAIDEVQDGETIVLYADCAETVHINKSNVEFTINGNNVTYTGKIEINVGQNVTIQNVKFVHEGDAAHDFIANVGSPTGKNYNTTLVVEGCYFTGNGKDNTVAVRTTHPTSVLLKNSTGTGLHSFLQNSGGQAVTVDDVTVTGSKSGISLGGVRSATVKNSNISVNTYGVRVDAATANAVINVESNTISAFIPVVARKASAENVALNVSGTNTFTATNTDGLWCAIGTSEYEENGTKPTDATGKVNLTITDTGLSKEGAYGYYVAPRTGSITIGFTSTTGVWGEAYNANAEESYVIELYINDTKIATSTLAEKYLTGNQPEITWSIPFAGQNNEDWVTVWEEGHPNKSSKPTAVKLVIDGKTVSENVVQMNGPDNLNPVEWDKLEALQPDVAQTKKTDGTVATYKNFEDAIAAAAADSTITEIVVLCDSALQSVKNTENYYDITGDLVITAPEKYTVSGCGFAVRVMGNGASLIITDNVTIEGLDVVANGFATTGENMTIEGTLKALSLKQWTNNGTIEVTETGKVWLGYGDGQFDMAYGNGTVTITGSGDKTEAQFKAGYSGTRGNGNTLNLKDTYFEGGAWFNVNGSNGTINADNALLKVSGGDGAGTMTIASSGNVINLTNGSELAVANLTIGAGNTVELGAGSKITTTKITGAGTIEIDVTGMTAGEVAAIVGDLSGFTGTVTVTGNDLLEAKIVDGKLVLSEKPFEAQIGDTKYLTLEKAVEAAKSGDEIIILNDVTLEATLTLPAGIILNGGGNVINGTVSAGGDLTIAGVTTVTGFSAGYYNNVITIGEGASLKVTGGRITVSYGNTFNITGSITDAKTADKSTITPSLDLVGGISFTGNGDGVNFNVTNAYVKLGDSTTKNSAATGEFNVNFSNSIVDFTKTLKTYMPTADGLAPEFNLTAKDSVVSFASHLELWLDNTTMTLDNTNMTVGGSFANAGTVNVTNGSNFVVKAPIMSSHGGNTGTINVTGGTFELVDSNQDWENAGTITVSGDGKLITNDFKNVGEGKLVLASATAMIVGKADLGVITEIPNATVKYDEENKTYIVELPDVAQVGNTKYKTIDEAIANWTNGTTLTLLSHVTLSDVIQLSSTEKHTLDLGIYTMTAASGKNAIEIVASGRSSESTALTINADAANPGGINAGSNAVVYYNYSKGTTTGNDRPTIIINGGVFEGSKNVASYGSSYTGGFVSIASESRKCPIFQINGGTFNCSLVLNRAKLIIKGGTFNEGITAQGDVTAYRLISGGTFKTWTFMTAGVSGSEQKFTVGNSKSVFDCGAYVDDNGYLVVGGPVITAPGDKFEASSTNYSGWSSYLQYSSAKDNGLYYTDAHEAFADNNKSTGVVTVYSDVDMTGTGYKGAIVIPEGKSISISYPEDTTPTWRVESPDGMEINATKTVVDGVVTVTYMAIDAVAQIGDTYYESLADVAKAIATDGSDTTIKILTDIELDSTVVFNYGTGKVIFTAVKPVTIKQTENALDLDFTVGQAANIVVEEEVTFEISDNTSGMYLYYGPSLTVNGTITGGENWGCLYLYDGEHLVGETGKVSVGRIQTGDNSLNVQGEVDTNYLLVEGASFTADGATVVADVIYDNYNGDQRRGASDFVIKNGSTVKTGKLTLSYEDSSLTIDLSSTLEADSIVGKGKIIIDGANYAGHEWSIKGDASQFEGTIEFINNPDLKYEITDTGIVIKEKVYVAKVGEQGYESLQAAVDAAKNGETVTLLKDSTENITVTQAPDVVITIDGDGKTMTGSITVDGKSQAYATAGLTIKDVKFDATNITTDASINLGDGTTATRYTCNVTVENCTFTGNYPTAEKSAIKNYTGGCKNLTVTGCTATGMHSLIQVKGVDGLTVNGGSVTESKNGISVGTSTNVVITDVNITATGYGIRADGTGAYDMTVKGSTISAADPIVVRKATAAGYKLDLSGNTLSASNENGYVVTFTTGDDGTYVAPSVKLDITGAEDLKVFPVYVASIGATYYTDLTEAFKAATSGCTIEILSDVTISDKWDCRDYVTNGSHSQFKEAVTIVGNEHTIKFTGTINDSNWYTIFRFEEDATVQDLTIDISEATGAQRVITAKKSLTVDNLTIVGSAKYGIIFGEGSSAEDLAAAEIVIKNSDLTGTRRAISDNENGKDVKSVVITGNKLNADVYVSASEAVTFTGNTVQNGYVDIRSYSADNVLAVIATGNTLTANTETKYNYIYAKTIEAQEEFVVEHPPFKVSTKDELDAALKAAQEGDTILLIADIDYGTTQLAITNAITLDLGGKTLTTRNAYGGMSVKGNPTIKNGTIVHASNTAAIKVWNAAAFEDLVIDVQGKGDANKTIGGIVLQSGTTTNVGSIKNVTIKGDALTNGIETYNCGDATENVIGSMENVTIDAKGTGMLISAPCGTATNCSISGDVNGIEIWIKGNYSASLYLVYSDVKGGVFAHDEFSSNPSIVNNGTLSLTVDTATTGASEEDITLTIARAEEGLEGILKEIQEKAQAKVNDTYYATIAGAMAAAAPGDTVKILEGTYDYALTVNKAITVIGIGEVTLNGVPSIKGTDYVVVNIDFVYPTGSNNLSGSGKIKDCSFTATNDDGNTFRYCYGTENAAITFEGCELNAPLWAIHFDSAPGMDLTLIGCEINGRVALGSNTGSLTATDTTFINGYVNVWGTEDGATFTGCDFNNIPYIFTGYDADNTFNFNDCNVDGGAKKIADVIYGGNDAAAAEIYVDGVLITGAAKIGNDYYKSVADAFAAAQPGDEVVILKAGTYALSTSGKDITITGAVDGVVFDNIGAKNMGGANVTFNNVTFDYYPNADYTGLQHSGDLKYNNCTFNGQVFLYGTSETFNDCTFNQNSADAYNVWTYGAKEVEFNGCTFNSAGKSVLIYTEDAGMFNDVTVTDCDFIATAPVEGKAAIEMDSSLTAGIKLTIDGETTVTGFGIGNVSGNSLWNNKKGNNTDANNDITVIVNGETVLAPVTFAAKIGNIGYTSIADAIKAANASETVTILAGDYTQDVSVNKAITVVGETDAEGNNLVNITGGISITADGAVVKNLTASNPATFGYNCTLTINAKNVLVEGCEITDANAMRYSKTTGNVTLKDCVLTATDTWAIHFDGATGGNVTVEGCEVNGWIAFAGVLDKVTLKDSTFTKGNWAGGRTYNDDVEISGCTFETGYKFDLPDSGAKAVVTDSKMSDGSSIEALFNSDDACGQNDITIDGEPLVYVAKIGNDYYKTLEEALANVAEWTTIKLTANATLDYTARDVYGRDTTTDIIINGQGFTLTLNQTNSDWASIGLKNADGKLTLKNMTIEKTGYGDTTGAWNTHAIIFSSNVEMTDVTVNNAIAVQAGATLNNVTINEANGFYGLWINGNGQAVTVNGGAINATNGGRGIKIADQYIDAPASVTLTVDGTDFNTAKKAAVLVSSKAGAAITATNVDIADVAEDTVNFVWVDEDWGAYFSKVTATGGTVVQENESAMVAAFLDADGNVISYFKTLQAAIDAAEAGQTVTLLKDFSVDKTVTVPAGKTVTLDLNGNTVSMETSNNAVSSLILNNGDLTVTDGSSEKSGKLSYNYTGTNGSDAYNTIETAPGSILTVKGGTIENLSANCLIAYAIDGLTNSGIGDVTVNIEGGVITSQRQSIRIFANSTTKTGTLNISGGEIIGRVIVQNANTNANKAALNITGGTFNTNAYKPTEVLYVGGSAGATIDMKPVVTGGTFYGEVISTLPAGFITGGTYKVAPEDAYLAPGYEVKYDSSSRMFNIVTSMVASVNGVDYTTVQDAVNAAHENGGTVFLRCDVVLTEKVEIPEGANITLDLMGKTLNGSILAKNADLTVLNGSIKNADSSVSAIEINAGTLTLTDVNIDSARHAVRIDGAVEATIDGGTYKAGIGTGKGTYHAVNVSGAANVTINNGTFVGPKGTVADSGAAVNVQSGATVSIIGGDFSGGKNNTLAAKGTLTVTGGTYDQDPSAFVHKDYKAFKNAAGKYEIVEKVYVVQIVGGEKYESLAEALTAAEDGDTIELLWTEGDAPIAMNGAVYGKSVIITGTATVDWSKGFLFIGRGGQGNGTVTFEDAVLISASNSASYGIHVSGREKNTSDKYDGTLLINNSTIELDYLINKGTMTLDASTLTVKNGFSIGGRPGKETESGADATATLNLTNGSKVVVNNHNGMGLGYEAIGVMNIDATSSFETTQSFLVTAKGTMNLAGTAKIAGTLTNNGSIVLKDVAATLTSSECGNVTTDVKDYEVTYADGVYKLIADLGADIIGGLKPVTDSTRVSVTTTLDDVYAQSELYVELWSGGTKLSTTTWNKAYPVSANELTVSIVLSGNSGSWNTEWHEQPTVGNIPDTIKVYVDGALADTFTKDGNAFQYTTDLEKYIALDEVYKAAKIGSTYYVTLQAAIDACVVGDNTIEVLTDLSEDVTIKQTEGVNITIDGGKKTYSGTITIHGNARYTGEETLTIQNVNFMTDEAGHYFIDSNSTGSVERYAHNVIVKDSTFTATGAGENSAAAMRIRQGYDIAIENVVTTGLHSLLQGYGIAGVKIDNVTVWGKNGISLGTSTDVQINNATINATGYGIRADGTVETELKITDANITANDPIVVRNYSEDGYKVALEGIMALYGTNTERYQVIFTTDDDGTYVAPDFAPVITGADGLKVFPMTLTAADVKLDGELTYNGEVQNHNIVAVDGATFTVSGDTSATNAGEYTAIVTGTGSYIGSFEMKWTIGKKAATITIADQTVIAGNDLPAPPQVTYEGVVDGDTLAHTDPIIVWTAEPGTPGTYEYVVDLYENPNYEITVQNGKLIVVDAVARLNGVNYTSLADAVKVAQDGDTIELLKDAGLAVAGKALTIKRNGNSAIIAALSGYTVVTDEAAYIIKSIDDVIVDATGAKLAYIDVNEAGYDGEELMSLTMALNKAQSGDTVKLTADLIDDNAVGTVIIPSGVTLDIEEHTLKADYIIGLNGSKLTGKTVNSSGVRGKLIVAKDNIALSRTPYVSNGISYLPIWMGDCYGFAQMQMLTSDGKNMGFAVTDESISFGFRHNSSTTVLDLMANNGAEQYGMSIVLTLYWNVYDENGDFMSVAHQSFVYGEDFVKSVSNAANKKILYLTIKNYADMNVHLDSLYAVAEVVTETGAAAYSADVSYK